MTLTTNTFTHLEALARDAEQHDKECHDLEGSQCSGHRVELVAHLMDWLELDLSDIGFIAEAWLDVQCEKDEPTASDDSILDAKEIGE